MFVEGKRTEEQYLKHWYRQFREHVLVHIDDFRGEPLSLVQRAIMIKKHEDRDQRRGRGRPHDQVWCMFDRDVHERFDEAVRLAADHSINLAISNPCLELWFVLHFQDQSAFLERYDAQRVAKRLLGCDTILTREALDALFKRHDEAAARAHRLDRKHEGDGSGRHANPSSGVWRLIESIRQ